MAVKFSALPFIVPKDDSQNEYPKLGTLTTWTEQHGRRTLYSVSILVSEFGAVYTDPQPTESRAWAEADKRFQKMKKSLIV